MTHPGSAARRVLLIIVSDILSIWLVAGAAWAAEPLATVREAVDRALAVLNDPVPADDAKRERMVREVSPYHDFAETARRSLGPHRSRASEAERAISGFLARHWELPIAPQGKPPAQFTPAEAALDCQRCHTKPVQ